MPRSRQTIGFLLGLLAVTIFGGSLPSTRLSVAELDPLVVTVLRTTVAGVVAVTLLAIARPPFPRRNLGKIMAIALCTVVGFPVAIAFASVAVPASHGGIVLGLLPLATAIGAVLFAGERPSAWFWWLSLSGAALVTAFALRDTELSVALGDLLLIGAILLAGLGYALAADLSRRIAGWQVIAWTVVVSLPVAIPLSIVLWPADAGAVSAWAWGGVVFSGVVVLFIGYALWNVALAWGGVAKVGQIQLLQPFVTILIAVPLLGESVDATMVAFAVAVAIVVGLGQRAVVRRSRPAG